MSEEIQLLRSYLDARVDPDHELGALRESLVRAIDLEVERPMSQRARAGHKPPWRRPSVLVTSLAAAALIAALLVDINPGGNGPAGRTSIAPATTHALPVGAVAQLHLIADHVVDQSIPRLSDGQLFLTRADLSVAASVNNGAAQAVIPMSVEKWSTAAGQTCVALTAQSAQFASSSAQAAWTGLGLRTLPQPPTAYQCLQGGGAAPPDAITGAGEAIDVSSLPTDPRALAQELEASTTGISALDQLTPDLAAPNLAFQRAAMILIGPVTGASAQFDSALFRAIALIPGVVALGTTPTHDGRSGQGFASGPGAGQTTIIVDPLSGQLLEVSGLDDSDSLTAIAGNYLGGGPFQVGQYSDVLQWLDPIGTPAVVSASQLPSDAPTYVLATANPGVTGEQLAQLGFDLGRQFFNSVTSNGGGGSTPPLTWEWSLNVPLSQASSFVEAVKASGLIQSVTVL
jgi:hypothetical protein